MDRKKTNVSHLVRIAAAGAAAALSTARAEDGAAPCATQTYADHDYIVCRFDPDEADIRLFLDDEKGAPYGHFNFVKDALAEKGERLVFAMNAGMYHEDRDPVGLYVEDGERKTPLNINNGPGNFHLKPNGVFFVRKNGGAAVMETVEYENFVESPEGEGAVAYATQSGPMLVIHDQIHPRFLPDSDSLKRRNGVGVTETGEVVFALSDAPVRFYDFAMFFRDGLLAPDALYLDGTISRLYAPGLGRNDPGMAMGPIVGVVAPLD